MSDLFTDTMTVYNYIPDEETESGIWQRSVIKGVQWRHNKNVVQIAGGIQTESKVESITVDFQRDYGNPQYVDPVIFLALPDKKGFWTLNARDSQDIIVLGISEKEISREYRVHQLKQDFSYCGTVTEVSDDRNRRFLKHIRVAVKV